MNKQNYKSIGNKIRFGYLFLIALFFIISASVTLATLYFNGIYNETITGIIKASRIQQIITDDMAKLARIAANNEKKYDNTKELAELVSNITYIRSTTSKDSDQIHQKINSLESLVSSYIQNSTQISGAYKNYQSGKIDEILQKMDKSNKLKDFIDLETKDLIIEQLKIGQQTMSRIKTLSTTLVLCISVLFMLVVVFALVYSMRLSGKISKSLGTLTSAAKTLGDGDFSGRDLAVTTNDELEILAGAFNTMKNNIRDISKRVVEAGFVIYTVSSELKKGVNTLYESSSQVAAAVHDVASTAESQCVSLHKHSKIVEETYILSTGLQETVSKVQSLDSKVSIDLSTISNALKLLNDNISKMNTEGKYITELSTRFAANSEEMAAATDEQLSIHKALLDTATKLDMSSQELEGLINNLKTTL
ncbi:MAG: HAMP domain-containing protein [Clostridia bacterium]|nr:HAMP domain-containing protein [Clostridia bacterium]